MRKDATPARQTSSLSARAGRSWGPRKVHGKHASPLREVARVEPAAVCFGAPSAEREPDAQAGPVGALLRERGGQFLPIHGSWKAATFVLYVDDHAIGAASNAQRHGSVWPSELERVLQQIAEHRRKDQSICLNSQWILRNSYVQRDAPSVGRQSSRGCNVVDEFGHEDPGPVHGACQPYFVEPASD